MYWVVYEIETGFQDGNYSQKSMAIEALMSWHAKRPEYQHVLLHQKGRVITDAEFLGIQHYKEENELKKVDRTKCLN